MACLENKAVPSGETSAPPVVRSHIPRLQRSASLRVRGERPINQSEDKSANRRIPRALPIKSNSKQNGINPPTLSEAESLDFDDAGSVRSGVSCASFMSCDINALHPHDMSSSASVHSTQGPCRKYVLHCQRHIAPTETKYLTPTQRKDRHIRQLKAALVRATRGWEEKEVEIQRLKSEVDRLRFSYSQSATSGSQQLCESPTTILEEDADSLDEAACVRPSFVLNGDCLEDSGILSDIPEHHFFQHTACKDASTEVGSNIYKNLNFASILNGSNTSCKETQTCEEPCARAAENNNNRELWDGDNYEDFSGWQKQVEEQRRRHLQLVQEMKEKHNNRIETLLHKLSDINAKYFEMRSGYEKSLERIRLLESQTQELRKEMTAQEEWHSQMYLKMYRKGQEAAKFEHADEVLEFAHKAPKRVSVPELLQQLHRTEHELEETKQAYRCEMYRHATTGDNHQAEYTLKFLKDAVYYYLTEKDNKGHLRAIESILGFNDKERASVARSQRQRKSLV